MKKLFRSIKDFFSSLRHVRQNFKNPWWRAKRRYITYYETLPIDERCILIESQHGKEMSGNVFYLLKYLSHSEKYADFRLYLSARQGKLAAFRKVLDAYDMSAVTLTSLSSDEYFQILASAKYLVNDNTFLPFFMKKEGQVYLNTWHGTPLKTLGRKIKNDFQAIGNAQRNFTSADYLLFPNEHTRDAILKDYMVENISRGSYLLSGYPRNEVFFDSARREELKEAFELQDKKIYAYMPTFRGVASKGSTPKDTYYLNYYLFELDKRLTDDEVMYLNLHPVATKSAAFGQFKHIQCFPAGYETYDFLNVADVLVSDYSSVFFDYACSRRKIVLFTYDKEEYLSDRGMYLSMDELPFPQVDNVEDLLAELRSEKNYDDTAFLERFAKYEGPNASELLCDRFILGKDTLPVYPIPNNGKENVLIYAGNLAGNGITASLRNLMNTIDTEKRNYYLCFYAAKLGKCRATLETFPETVSYFSFMGDPNITVRDLFWRKPFKEKKLSTEAYMKHQGKRVKQEFERKLGRAKFDRVVQFTGYEPDVLLEFLSFDGPTAVYVHANMVQEIELKGNQRKDVLHYVYNRYDRVAVVTKDMTEPTVALSGTDKNIVVTKNLITHRTILEKGNAEAALDPFTKCNRSEEEVMELLDSDAEIFLNVGRFAPEKGHERLMQAFHTYAQTHDNAYLMIMGGYSLNNGYQKLLALAEELNLSDRVILLENVSNPYPIIKKCSYFVLSSFYEGFGLVLAEADILGLPVISTDIPGPRGFMLEHGGTLVDNSEEGLLRGMELLHDGKVPMLEIDYDIYNQLAVEEFESLLSC